ncbi:helix-turn-helix transcriptional regulator [Pediococcus argentinicus]|uniref:helix-turn-helix transcriptional regulator n=1 Tax=Pediococcus argentinicus TaxID=480391 RepID=UPI00338F2489
MEKNPQNVGNRIKQLRMELGLTQAELAKKINSISGKSTAKSGTVNNWEQGLNLPNKSRLKIIADLGNVSVSYLLTGKSSGGFTIKQLKNETSRQATGKRIKAIRHDLDESITTFANHFENRTKQDIENWENGDVLPSTEEFIQLGNLSGLDPLLLRFGPNAHIFARDFKENQLINNKKISAENLTLQNDLKNIVEQPSKRITLVALNELFKSIEDTGQNEMFWQSLSILLGQIRLISENNPSYFFEYEDELNFAFEELKENLKIIANNNKK